MNAWMVPMRKTSKSFQPDQQDHPDREIAAVCTTDDPAKAEYPRVSRYTITRPPKMLPNNRSARLSGLAISSMMLSGVNAMRARMRQFERLA